jgi:VanZ family protein
VTVLCLSGDWGAGKNTLDIIKWLSSWFVDLELAQLRLLNFYVRKTGHVLAYGLMYGFWFRAFRAQTHYGPWGACFWSLGLCLLFASMDEGRQCYYASRGASIRDVILDMSGASLMALIAGAVWTPGSKSAAISGIGEGQAIGPE